VVDPAAAAELRVQGRVPSPAERAAAVEQIQQRHWLRNEAKRTATRLSTTPQLFASLAKTYVLDRAAEAALATPILGAMVNLGGDLVVRGDLTRLIDVRDPNEGTATQLTVQDRAVATSGAICAARVSFTGLALMCFPQRKRMAGLITIRGRCSGLLSRLRDLGAVTTSSELRPG